MVSEVVTGGNLSMQMTSLLMRRKQRRSQHRALLFNREVLTNSKTPSKFRYPSEFLEPRGALRAPCGNSARRAKDFFGVAKSARARRWGFEPTFRRKSLFASEIGWVRLSPFRGAS